MLLPFWFPVRYIARKGGSFSAHGRGRWWTLPFDMAVGGARFQGRSKINECIFRDLLDTCYCRAGRKYHWKTWQGQGNCRDKYRIYKFQRGFGTILPNYLKMGVFVCTQNMPSGFQKWGGHGLAPLQSVIWSDHNRIFSHTNKTSKLIDVLFQNK